MADARMLFQLVSLRLRLSDSSLESTGSTSGVARCRRTKRMGFVYLTQAVAIFRYSDSSPVIVVAAPHLSVLAVKVITADRFASRKVICSRVLSLGAALAYLSIAVSSLMSVLTACVPGLDICCRTFAHRKLPPRNFVVMFHQENIWA